MKTIKTEAIINEKGHIVEYVSDLTGAEINAILAKHPEYKWAKVTIVCACGTTINDELEGVGF